MITRIMPEPTTDQRGGYICKRCHAPSPTGVGFYAPDGDAAVCDALTECPCGYSVNPLTHQRKADR